MPTVFAAILLLLQLAAKAEQVVLCTNTCLQSVKHQCDDGGLGSAFPPLCIYGTDCADCGPRTMLVSAEEESPPSFASTAPTVSPTLLPPTARPTTNEPTAKPSKSPTREPTKRPSKLPTVRPIPLVIVPGETTTETIVPSAYPTKPPTSLQPTIKPTKLPSPLPTKRPTAQPVTKTPTVVPTRRTTKEPVLSPAEVDQVWLCNELCPWSNDGECDDGGPGSTGMMCIYGSDCKDCGVRDPK